ncbi:MAG: exopolysaccharide biosynthesis protein [Pseudooceanicola sp.]
MSSSAPADKAGPELRSLTDILDALEETAQDDEVSVSDVVAEFGTRAYAPLLLVPALILITPLSGIPTLPTIGAALMFLICVQKLMGRSRLWLPDWLQRRRVNSERLLKSVEWLRGPCAWVDRRTHKRLPWLVTRPANAVTLSVIVAICIIIPFLEILPLVTSLFAISISLFAVGIFTRDGLFTLIGHGWILVAAGTIWWLVTSGSGMG